ncbi:MAG TPA: flagellar protein FlaG [Symbiobacteriaceae bacterium]
MTEVVDRPKGQDVAGPERRPTTTLEVTEKQHRDLEEAVEKMNEVVRIFDRALQFEVVKPHRIVIRVVDTRTGEVIRQMPPEKLLEAFYRMEEALGLLLDEKA